MNITFVDICLHMYEQRRQNCSTAVQLCTVSAEPSLPYDQNVECIQIHNTRNIILSPSPAAKPGCQECSQQTYKPSSSSPVILGRSKHRH